MYVLTNNQRKSPKLTRLLYYFMILNAHDGHELEEIHSSGLTFMNLLKATPELISHIVFRPGYVGRE
jgi:hypothetical protein